jgi:hypothetical protein
MESRLPKSRLHGLIPVAVLALFALNALGQAAIFRATFVDEISTGYLKPYTDGEDYMGRAYELARGEGFTAAFRDGIRMPGYPALLALFAGLLDKPVRAVRMAQVVLSSAVILLAWLLLSSLLRSRAKALFCAGVFAVWAPFYYFSPVLYAETASIFLIGLFCYALALFDPGRSPWTSVPAAITAAALVYLKPNHILLVPVLLVFLVYVSRRGGARRRAKIALIPVVVVICLLAPWSIFVSRCQDSFVPLTTHGGWNLYLGTGGGLANTKPWARGSLPTRAWNSLNLKDLEHPEGAYGRYPAEMRARADRDFRTRALERWKRRPLALTAYGAAKMLHVAGFSFRRPRDVIVMLHFIGSLILSVYLWKRRRWREWALLLWMIAIVVMAQAFLFLPELRFKTVLFDFPALVVSMLGICTLLESGSLARPRSGGSGMDRRCAQGKAGTPAAPRREAARLPSESQRYRGPLALAALDHDFSAVGVHDLLAEMHAQSIPSRALRPRLVHAVERLENERQLLLRYAAAVIPNGDREHGGRL